MSEFLRPIPELHVGRGSNVPMDPGSEESYRVRRLCQRLERGNKNRASALWNEWRVADCPPFEGWYAKRSVAPRPAQENLQS